MTREFLQQSLDNQYYIELHLLVSFILSHGLRGYMHAHIRVSVEFKIVSRKTAKTFSQEYIRIEHFFIWLATCNELPEPVFKKLPMGVVSSSNPSPALGGKHIPFDPNDNHRNRIIYRL